jgi:hypothetical protein
VRYAEQLQHLDVCPLVSVSCPNSPCPVTSFRLGVEAHLRTCPLTVVPCVAEAFGCTFRGERQTHAIHLVERFMDHHIMTLLHTARSEYWSVREHMADLRRGLTGVAGTGKSGTPLDSSLERFSTDLALLNSLSSSDNPHTSFSEPVVLPSATPSSRSISSTQAPELRSYLFLGVWATVRAELPAVAPRRIGVDELRARLTQVIKNKRPYTVCGGAGGRVRRLVCR